MLKNNRSIFYNFFYKKAPRYITNSITDIGLTTYKYTLYIYYSIYLFDLNILSHRKLLKKYQLRNLKTILGLLEKNVKYEIFDLLVNYIVHLQISNFEWNFGNNLFILYIIIIICLILNFKFKYFV